MNSSASPVVALTLAELNAVDTDIFTSRLADIFEHSAWVAERSAAQRPFASVAELHQAMCEAVQHASSQEQLALLRAHPELAGRQAQQDELTAASAQEQARAGLKALSEAEMEKITALNAAYRDRHGFPFIVCVARHDKQSLFKNFEQRAGNAPAIEHGEALAQVADIARLRLNQLIAA